MTTLTLNLRQLLARSSGIYTVQLPASIDLDLCEVLRSERAIAIVWQIQDVKDRRPDLTDEQCWTVLQAVENHHDANCGISWDTIEAFADSLFPPGTEE